MNYLEAIQSFTSRIAVAPPLPAFVTTRSLRFLKGAIAFLSLSAKLFSGSLFLSENLSTTPLLTASINVFNSMMVLCEFSIGFIFDTWFYAC